MILAWASPFKISLFNFMFNMQFYIRHKIWRYKTIVGKLPVRVYITCKTQITRIDYDPRMKLRVT